MVYVRIELWPGGDRERARLLQELVIANMGGDERAGVYRAALSHATTYRGEGFAEPARPAPEEVWKRGERIPHARRRSPAHLVQSVLGKLLGGAR